MVYEVAASFLASGIAESFCYPIDTLKTWMQVRASKAHLSKCSQHRNFPAASAYKYNSIKFYNLPLKKRKEYGRRRKTTTELVQKVIKRQPSAFYRGFTLNMFRVSGQLSMIMMLKAPICRQITSVAGSRAIKQPSNKNLHQPIGGSELLAKVIGSSISSVICTGFFIPMDIIKIRMQADSYKKPIERRYSGYYNAFRNFISRNGVAALWTGSAPKLGGAATYYGTSLPGYETAKSILIHDYHLPDTISTHMMCSIFSGMLGVTMSQPFDLIRTRMVNQSVANPKYKTSTQCVRHVLKNEGAKGLFTGLLPRYGRVGPWQVIFFVVYEQMLALNPQLLEV